MADRFSSLIPNDNVYVIKTAADLPQVVDRWRLYHLLYDPGAGIGLYYSPDAINLVRLASGGGGGGIDPGTIDGSTTYWDNGTLLWTENPLVKWIDPLYLELNVDIAINWLDSGAVSQELLVLNATAVAGDVLDTQFVNFTTQVTTTSITYVDVPGAQLDTSLLIEGDEYLLLGHAYLFNSNSGFENNFFRMVDQDETEFAGSEHQWEQPPGATTTRGKEYVYLRSFVATVSGDEEISMQYKQESALTLGVNAAFLAAINVTKLGSNFVKNSSSVDQFTAGAGNWVGAQAAVNIGNGVDDYLVLITTNHRGFNGGAGIELGWGDGAAIENPVGNYDIDASAGSGKVCSFWVVLKAPANINIRPIFRTSGGVSWTMQFCSTMAINLSAFKEQQSFTVASVAAPASAAERSIANLNFTAGVTTDWLVFGGVNEGVPGVVPWATYRARSNVAAGGDVTRAGNDTTMAGNAGSAVSPGEFTPSVPISVAAVTALDNVDINLYQTPTASFAFQFTTNVTVLALSLTLADSFVHDFIVGDPLIPTRIDGSELSIAGSYTLPLVDGTAGQALITDGAGVVDWGTAAQEGIQGLGLWRYRTETGTPPASGQIRFDNADISSATEFYLSETNDGGFDVSVFLDLLLIPGAIVYVQDRSDAANAALIEVGTVVDSGTYRTVQIINIIEEGTEPSQNQQVAFFIGGSGAGGFLPVGTVVNSTLHWDGASWIEVPNVRTTFQLIDVDNSAAATPVTLILRNSGGGATFNINTTTGDAQIGKTSAAGAAESVWVNFRRGGALPDVGFIEVNPPVTFNYDTFSNTTPAQQFLMNWAPNPQVTGNYIGGCLQTAAVFDISTALFIPAIFSDTNRYNVGLAPGFSAITFINELSVVANDGNFNLPSGLVINVGMVHERNTSGTSTTPGTTGMNFSPQSRTLVSGAVMTKTDQTGLRISPTWSTVAGSTANLGTIRGMHCFNPAVGIFQPGAGIETMTAYYGLDMNNITFGGTATVAAVRSALAPGTNQYFLLNNGNAVSDFGIGHIYFDDNAGVAYGGVGVTTFDFWSSWNATGYFRQFFLATASSLRWSSPVANRFLFDSDGGSVDGEYNFNCAKFSMGAQTGAVGNQVGVFAAGTRSTQLGGEWADFLLTQAANITVDHAMGAVMGWAINSPSITIGTGSVTDTYGLSVGGSASGGSVNRAGVRILSNPSGGSGVNAALWLTDGTLVIGDDTNGAEFGPHDLTDFITTFSGTTDWEIFGLNSIVLNSTFQMAEQAANNSPAAGFGEFWVRNDIPNVPMFTDDAGTDFVLNAGGGGSPFATPLAILGDTDGAPPVGLICELQFWDQDQSDLLADLGFTSNTADFHIRNKNHGGVVYIEAEDSAGTTRNILQANPDNITILRADTNLQLECAAGAVALTAIAGAQLELRHNGIRTFQTQLLTSGGGRLWNSYSGQTTNYERILTSSDIVKQVTPLWEFSSGTGGGGPSAGHFAFDSGTLGSITECEFDDQAIYGNTTDDFGNFYSELSAGDILYFRGEVDETSLLLMIVDGVAVDDTGYWTIPMSYISGTLPNNNERYSMQVQFLSQASGGGVGVSGTPTNDQIAVWTNATTIEGAVGFEWNNLNLNISTVGGVMLELQDNNTTGAGAAASIAFLDQVGTTQGAIGTLPIVNTLLVSAEGTMLISAGNGTDVISVSGYLQPMLATDAELDDITDAINTDPGKRQGSMIYNSSQDIPVWAVGNADGDLWVDGTGATVNTPV